MAPSSAGRHLFARRRRRLLAVALITAVVVALVATVVVMVRDAAAERITASSTAAGFDAADLLDADGKDPVWRSDGTTTGTSLTLHLDPGTAVGEIRLAVPDSTDRMTQGHLLFSDGSALLLTPSVGRSTVTFTPRSSDSVTLVVDAVADGARAVELAGLRVDSDGRGSVPSGDASSGARAVASSTSSGDAASLLGVSGPALANAPGWASAPGDREPSVHLTWEQPLELASVRLYGAAGTAGAAKGRLDFDDGSTIPFAAVLGGAAQGAEGDATATTVAFMPRSTAGVSVVLTSVEPGAVVGLRAVQVYAKGSTPPDDLADGTTASGTSTTGGTTASGTGCSADAPVGEVPQRPQDRRLVCPAPGTAVPREPTVVVAAPPGTALTATAALQGRSESVVASAVADASGRAVLEVQEALPPGPVNLRVEGAGDPLWVQLVAPGSAEDDSASYAPKGMTLAYQDTFQEPLSISATGEASRYAADRPTAGGTAGYGDAAFGAPALQERTAETDDGLLRLRTEPMPAGGVDPDGYGRDAVGALVSSAGVGGAGFSAQYAYFETRALGAPGAGTWPAFWMLTTPDLAGGTSNNAEVDAFEMYGHDTQGLCNSTHDYRSGKNVAKEVECNPMSSGQDWALEWHTYGARVLPDVVIFTTDGVETARIPRPLAADEPFFFMLTLARGGGWPEDLSGTAETADMYVDWVRVYT